MNHLSSSPQSGFARRALIALAVSTALLTGCGESEQTPAAQSVAKKPTAETTTPVNQQQSESQRANAMFDEFFTQAVMRSPMYQSYLGIKQDQDKWDDLSEQRAHEDLAITKANLAKLKSLDYQQLDEQTKLSYRLMQQQLEDDINDFKWRHYNYPLNQMYGLHSGVVSLLINQHAITDKKDAEDYLARLNALPALFTQLSENLNLRASKGIIAPRFVYPYVIDDSKNIISGAPFEGEGVSPIYQDFSQKLAATEIAEDEQKALLAELDKAMLGAVGPAYQSLIETVEKLADKADSRDGVWKFPDGDAFYNRALINTTTTALTADEIHAIGLQEVERIHSEMRAIMKSVNFTGSLQDFFKYLREDKRFVYPNTEQGRQQYLTEATAYIDNMKQRLDELFITKPKADLIVKAVEPFREKSAGKAFYQQPSMDGSRPGTYYANLYDMEAMPIYQMEALAYHEGIPGHHMQIAIAQELEGIPKFRKFGRYTAYTEGWGLYSERVPKEIGLYQDPYSDFGRLAMELWRACRLVVDTGIHAKKWTREQGIEYYMNNTPNAQSDAVKMVERHIVMPGQATAYKIGMIKIIELREKAKQTLKDQFDIREFHDVVLAKGPVPLNVLETFVDDYIASKQAPANN
ncbi:MAG: DUF885 domain-containing protein [Gammaproteobacteria bacterium]|nr:DUF885 domain-containing protein [Gammaproteobacteria bacterium]NVK87534.1 DUF885 domain-containing protein [Gammaproteobacteria bacterium]